MLLFSVVDDEDTAEVGLPPPSDTDRSQVAVFAHGDTDEWDTDREIIAQGTLDTNPVMFEDTGVVIIDLPVERPVAQTDSFVVTFRAPSVKRSQRAATADEWPPPPRQPATRAPAIRERALKNAAIYTIVKRPDTKAS